MIRSATHADRASLGRIAYDTGYFGASAERYFPDRELFADLWVGPSLGGAGRCNLVAESAGEVVGYILGIRDPRAYRRHFVRVAPALLGRLLRGDYPQWRGCLPYLLRLARYPAKSAPAREFPAQLHINVLAAARGRGLGRELLAAHLDCLGHEGVGGVQLSTTRENEAALRLYEAFGFEEWRAYESPLWRPWLGRNAVHVVMIRRL